MVFVEANGIPSPPKVRIPVQSFRNADAGKRDKTTKVATKNAPDMQCRRFLPTREALERKGHENTQIENER